MSGGWRSRTATAPTSSTSRRCRGAAIADLGAGSVHHIAFAVENRAKQLEVRKALLDTGYHVTPVIDRDYFWAIYFRTPGGVLFEVATNEPGFDRDEDTAPSRRGAEAAEPARASADLSRKAPAAARQLIGRPSCPRTATSTRRCPVRRAARCSSSSTAPAATSSQLVSLGQQLMPDAAIISPRGDVSEHGAARFFRRTGEGVYDMDDLARAPARWRTSSVRIATLAKPGATIGSRLFERRQHPGVGAVFRTGICSTRSC